MTHDTLTANQWPGPPRQLPPLVDRNLRTGLYIDAALWNAEQDTMFRAWVDLGQRIAIKSCEGVK